MTKALVTENASPEVPVKVEQRIAEYIKTRDTIAKRKQEFEESIQGLVDLQASLTGWLQNFMDTSGVDSVKTKGGTAYSSTKFTASLADPEAFMQFVINTSQFDMLDRKANVTAVKQYVEDNGGLPPGVTMSAIKQVGVRRPSK